MLLRQASDDIAGVGAAPQPHTPNIKVKGQALRQIISVCVDRESAAQ